MTARTRARRSGIAGLVVGATLLASASLVGAQAATSLDDFGWWSKVNQDAALAPLAAPPDVSEGQLLVEGTPDGATALAALRFTIPEGMGSPVLTLTAASDLNGDGALLLACVAGSSWRGAHAGNWDLKAKPDCSRSVQGSPSEDGTEWIFPLATLQFDDQINVVLTPGKDPEQADGFNSSSFRIVFEEPTAESLQVSPAPDAAPSLDLPDIDLGTPLPAGSGGSVGDTFEPSFTPIDSGSSSFTPSVSPPSDFASAPIAEAALPDDEQGQTPTSPVLGVNRGIVPAAVEDATDGATLAGVAVFLAALGLLWWSTTQTPPERMVLSRFAATAAGAGGPASVVPTAPDDDGLGGLGRFRRMRSSPARRLGG